MDANHAVPTISRVLEDGTLVELVFDQRARSTALAIRDSSGALGVDPHLQLSAEQRLIPYSADNDLIAKRCVLLPSAIGSFQTKAALVEELQAFIHAYVDLSPTFEAIAAHYVLLSWVFDRFTDLPYLRLCGDYGTGKTRALQVIGSICHKPFFASGASTVSPIFHLLEEFAGTLLLDEADLRASDATAELTKILNNGTTRGMPLLRTMTNRNRELHPRAFRVFGPKIVAMRESFADAALESRFITERTGRRALRTNVPVHLPASFADEAEALRNKLLAWRFSAFEHTAPNPQRLADGLSPRARQTVLSLLSVIDDAALREAVCAHVGSADGQLQKEKPAPLRRLMLDSLLGAYEREGAAGAAIGVITQLFNEQAEPMLGKPMTNRWVAAYVRREFGLTSVKSHGTFAVPRMHLPQVKALCERTHPAPVVSESVGPAGLTSRLPV